MSNHDHILNRISLASFLRTQDCFRVYASACANLLECVALEAWTPSREKEVELNMLGKGFKKVEKVTFGDHDLTLWECPRNIVKAFEKTPMYAVSLNVGQYNPGSKEDQLSSTESKPVNLKSIMSQLEVWIEKYGNILISSYRDERIQQYWRIFSRYFKGKFDVYFDRFGFVISKKR